MSNTSKIESMFKAGAHFGLARSRRNPTVSKYIFGTKNNTDIFDLEKTVTVLDQALEYVKSLGSEGKTILFVGGKKEASNIVKNIAQSLNMPYVEGRWIGGTLTNFIQIRKRVDRFEKLISDKEKGELAKYTKKERMLIDKEIEKLDKMFSGIVSLKKTPDVLIVVDSKREDGAVKEAKDMKVKVVALANSDCDISDIDYPIVGNDGSRPSIQYFLEAISASYGEGKKNPKKEEVKTK